MIRSDVDATERSICAAIRGVSGVWRDLPPAGEGRLLADAARHRVKPLLASRLHAAGELANWPRAIAHHSTTPIAKTSTRLSGTRR